VFTLNSRYYYCKYYLLESTHIKIKRVLILSYDLLKTTF